MTRVEGFLGGVWEFVVGDDWRTAIGVVLAFAVTALIASAAIAAWWVMPVAVVGLLALSVRRAGRGTAPGEVESRGRRLGAVWRSFLESAAGEDVGDGA
jgi:hypothetical protein